MAEINSQNTSPIICPICNSTVELKWDVIHTEHPPYGKCRKCGEFGVIKTPQDTLMSLNLKSMAFSFEWQRVTDTMLNDAIAGLSQQDKVAFLQSIFGRDWQEHYQGEE